MSKQIVLRNNLFEFPKLPYSPTPLPQHDNTDTFYCFVVIYFLLKFSPPTFESPQHFFPSCNLLAVHACTACTQRISLTSPQHTFHTRSVSVSRPTTQHNSVGRVEGVREEDIGDSLLWKVRCFLDPPSRPTSASIEPAASSQ